MEQKVNCETFFRARQNSVIQNLCYETLFSDVEQNSLVRNHFFQLYKNRLLRNLIRPKPKKGLEFVAILEILFRFRTAPIFSV